MYHGPNGELVGSRQDMALAFEKEGAPLAAVEAAIMGVTPDRLLRNSKLLHPTNCVSQMQATAQMHRGTSTKNGSTHERKLERQNC